jgi:hypothetical protein
MFQVYLDSHNAKGSRNCIQPKNIVNQASACDHGCGFGEDAALTSVWVLGRDRCHLNLLNSIFTSGKCNIRDSGLWALTRSLGGSTIKPPPELHTGLSASAISDKVQRQ